MKRLAVAALLVGSGLSAAPAHAEDAGAARATGSAAKGAAAKPSTPPVGKPVPPTRPTPPTRPAAIGQAAGQNSPGKPATTKPPSSVPAVAKPVTGRPAAKPDAARPAPGTPATKPGDAKPGDPKPGGAKPDPKAGASPDAAKPEPKRPDEDSFDDDASPATPTGTPTSSAPAPVAQSPAVAPAQRLDVHVAPPPDQSYTWRSPVIIPTLTWLVFQFLPSAEIAIGRQRAIAADGTSDGGPHVTWGLRWQFTPLLWSWGVHRKQSPWRIFVVDPLARVSGSLELSTTVEYIGGEVNRGLFRPGLRAYFPLLDRGEYLATSIGTSIYRYDDSLRVAYDAGVYVLSGILGVNVTFAPTHAPLTSIVTFNLRYF